ncbi:MAG: hypothetical protein GXX84_16860 [Acidobacteria bacterium]|nr:hypothetical protein [Acidobacteriota bacterium]
MVYFRLLAFCLLLTAAAATAEAQRRFIVGNSYDFAFGGTNQGTFSSAVLERDIVPFYGFYPAVDVRATGSTTQINLYYMALAERYGGEQSLNTLSHSARAGFTASLGRALKLRFGGSFLNAPDYTTVDVLQGSGGAPDSFRFVFQPSSARSTRRTFRGTVAAEINMNYRSYIIAEASAMSLRYLNNDQPLGLLLDQTRSELTAGYGYRLNPYDSVDVQYGFIQNDYRRFGTGTTQAAVVGLTRSFSPYLQMRVEGGPAFISFDQTGETTYGYVASVEVRRTIRSSRLTASYYHSPGDSSGLSSLSELHTVGLSIFSPLGSKFSVAASAAGFIGRSEASSLNDYHGIYGSLDLSYPVSRYFFLTWGGSYRRNSYGNPLDQEFKRVYMSVRFRAPELWRAEL